MENLRKLGFLGADGKPLDERLSKVLNALLPRFRRRFPAIQDDVEVTEVVRGGRAPHHQTRTQRPDRSRSLEAMPGRRWRASACRCSDAASMQIRVNRVESRTGPDIVSQLRAWDGSVEEIERGILLRELEAHMTPEEAWIFHLKAFGFSSEEIAKLRGSSVNSVDKVMSRLKQKIHALTGVKE